MLPLTPNLLEPASLLDSQPLTTTPAVQTGNPELREFGDPASTRANIYQKVLEAAQAIEPISNELHTLRLTGVDYQDPDRVSKQQQKEVQ